MVLITEVKKHCLKLNSQGRPLGKNAIEPRSKGLKKSSHMKSQEFQEEISAQVPGEHGFGAFEKPDCPV